MREECGVCACILKKESCLNLPSVLHTLLNEIQHRGQTSAGIAVFSPNARKRLKTKCEVGKVSNLFRSWDKNFFNDFLINYSGQIGLGHVRYATTNVSDDVMTAVEEAQPFLRRHGRPSKKFAIAFNGHLTNYSELKEGLIREGYYLDTDVDTEVLMHLISLSIKKNWDESIEGLNNIFEEVIEKLDGSFSFVFLNALGDLVIARDKLGLRPLVIGENENVFAVASESKALSKLGIEKFRDIKPGEIVVIRDEKMHSFGGSQKYAKHCHFEYVYFSDPSSVNDGIVVNEVREKLGKALAKEENIKFSKEDTIVVPVPSTSFPIAAAYSQESNIPLSFSLIKGDVGRGFINGSFQRKIIMDSKYNVVANGIKGKKVILVDDSIVRGETSARVIKLLRLFGAKEVHFRSGESPIKFPCCYGVDFPSFEELILGNYRGGKEEAEEIVARKIGADSVRFVSFEGLRHALGGEDKFCFACLDGKYPTKAGCEFLNGKLKEA